VKVAGRGRAGQCKGRAWGGRRLAQAPDRPTRPRPAAPLCRPLRTPGAGLPRLAGPPHLRVCGAAGHKFGGSTMFEQLLACLRAVARQRTGPLAEERPPFLTHLAGQGMTR
jgi:hypothetical protein